MYADDTASLCTGNDITVSLERAQRASDALVNWARRSKMTVAPANTQVLVLSQSHRDTAGVTVMVGGQAVPAGGTLSLLGVTLDRRLQFGPHCRRLRNRVRPRLDQLRQIRRAKLWAR